MWGGNRGREGFEQKAREMSIILGGGEGGGAERQYKCPREAVAIHLQEALQEDEQHTALRAGEHSTLRQERKMVWPSKS